MSDEELYSISEVAQCFGLSVPTLRYYEEEGLLEPSRRISRVRHYDHGQLIRLAYVLMWHRDAGMTIDETRTIVETRVSHERHQLIAGHICAISEQIDRLVEARATLDHLLGCPADEPESCPDTGAKLQRRVAEALSRLR